MWAINAAVSSALKLYFVAYERYGCGGGRDNDGDESRNVGKMTVCGNLARMGYNLQPT